MIPVLVIAGGDCSGKSRLIKKLAETYQDRVLICPEVATIIYGSQMNPLPYPADVAEQSAWHAKFERFVTGAQLFLESWAQDEAVNNDSRLIILDRGIFDHYAYLNESQWQEFESSYNISRALLAKRYTSVLYLESLVLSDPNLWREIKLNGNDSRLDREQEEMAALEKKLRIAWESYQAHGGQLYVVEGKRPEDLHFTRATQIIDKLLA